MVFNQHNANAGDVHNSPNILERCCNCRWWGAVPPSQDYESTFIDAEIFDIVDFVHKPCGSPKMVYAGKMSDEVANALPLDATYYFDFGSYRAGFRTGPSFGCVQFEHKLGDKL